MTLQQTLLQASELDIRLEIVNDLPIWEAQPLYRHQKHVSCFGNETKWISQNFQKFEFREIALLIPEIT